MNDHDLFLKFRFTDRGGSSVYEIFEAEDNKRLKNPLGEIRITDTNAITSSARIKWVEEEDVNDRLAADYNPDQLELDV